MKRQITSLAYITLLPMMLLLSCKDKKTQEELSEFQEKEAIEASNIEIVKRFYRLLDEQDLYACNEMFSADGKGFMGSSEESFKFEDIIPFIQLYYFAFPDYKHHIENIFATDEYVVTQLKYTGTHSGKFMEIDSTGNKLEYKGIFIFKMAEGKIFELCGMEDDITMWNQLGLELK